VKTFWDAIDDFCQFGESCRSEVEAQMAAMKALADDMEAALAEGCNPADVVAQWRACIVPFDAYLNSDGGFEALNECLTRLVEVTNQPPEDK
jgi:hypothetical protein